MDLPSLLRKLRPILGDEQIQRIWEELQIADPKTARLIELSLRRRIARGTGFAFQENGILLDPMPQDRSSGDFALGTVHYGRRPLHPFALRKSELIQHVGIFGRSGAGKTNLCFLFLRELARQRIPFLILDWKKNYRDLLTLPDFRDLVVYTVGRDEAPFFFNPLVPPRGVQPKEWIKKLTEVCQHAYFLGEGVAYLLQEAIDRLYREFGVYEGSGRWPTFRDLLTTLKAWPVKGREAAWMESTLRAIGVLNFGAMDWVLNAGPHISLETLLSQPAVLELDALTNVDKTFLIEALLLAIHHRRMHEGQRERLKHVLVIEEAHHVLLRKKQELTGAEAVTDVILREVREFGQAIVLLDQLPSLISKPALENTFTTVSMNLKEKGDVTAAAKAMLLEPDEARYLGRLPVGEGIVKLQARWVKPFLVSFPLFPIRKATVTDDQVHRRFLDSFDVEAAARMMKEGWDVVERPVWSTIPEIERLAKTKEPTSPNHKAPELADDERAVLEDVAEHPTSTVTDRYRRLGLNNEQGTKLVSALVGRDLLESAIIPDRRSMVRILALTHSGRTALDLSPDEAQRYGGIEHRYWVERIAQECSHEGMTVQKEAAIGEGRTVDVLVTTGGRTFAVEVETGRSDWKGNARKCRAAGLEVVVAPTRAWLRTEMDQAFKGENGVVVVPGWAVKEVILKKRKKGTESGRKEATSADAGAQGAESAESGGGQTSSSKMMKVRTAPCRRPFLC